MSGKKVFVDRVQQSAIFDGKTDFMPLSAAIYLVNHYSAGGTPNDMMEIKSSGVMKNPKRYKVTLTLEYEECEST